MPDQQTTAPVWVSTQPQLLEMIRVLESNPFLSVDTESNSLYVYHEQVCLIQISISSADYLIDPLSLKDLSPLAPVFANPKQEKIFHAAEYDLICLKRDFNFQFSNIFDTMVAARILGETSVGLASLLNSRLGLTLEKKYQRANWGIRPLSPSMLEYARQDSRYLYPLRVILEKELRERGLWDLALEDFRLGCASGDHLPLISPVSVWKVAGAAEINPSEAAVLQELCDYREEQAQRQNVPPFRILSNELLVQLSKNRPESLDALSDYKGMTPHVIQRFGNGILQAVQRGISAPPLMRPPKVRPDDHYLRRYDAVKEWRKLKGQALKVESDVILPRDFLEIIAAENPQTPQELHQIMARIPWRYQHFSKEIFSVLRKQEVA